MYYRAPAITSQSYLWIFHVKIALTVHVGAYRTHLLAFLHQTTSSFHKNDASWTPAVAASCCVAIFRVRTLHAQTNCQRSSFSTSRVQLGPYGWLESKVAWEIGTYCESRNADESKELTLARVHHCVNERFILTQLLKKVWIFCFNCPWRD